MKKILLLAPALFLLSQTAGAQVLVSSEYLGHKTKAQLEQFDTPMLTGADYYRVTYETAALDGSTTVVSGLLAVPDDLTKRYPRAVYLHGTSANDADVPSNLNFESNIALALCGKGYVMCAPDYLGLGENEGLHPYVHAASEAWVAADMLRASATFLADNNVAVNDQMFVTGYSQGGHSAMALHRMMELELASEFTVTAAAPMSGPYSIGEVMRDLIFSDEPYGNPGYLAYTMVSYQLVYGNLYASVDDAVKPPYVQLITDFSNDEVSLEDMNTQLTALLTQNEGAVIAGKIFKDDYVLAAQTDPNHPVNIALLDNNVYDWTPAAPTRLYYCQADEQVPFENSITAEATMQANGAPDVAAVNVNSFLSHAFCAFYAPGEAADFFAQFQQIDPLSGTGAVAASSPLELSPNPADDVVFIKNLPAGGMARIHDLSGRLLLSQNMLPGDNTLDISGLAGGIYLLEVLSDGFFWQEKVAVR